MLLAFVVFVIGLLHIQFFVRNILFGLDEATFFTFTIKYHYGRDVALESLYFSCGCLIAFSVGFLMARQFQHSKRRETPAVPIGSSYGLPLWPLVASGMLQVVASLSLVIQSGFQYQLIAEQQLESGFIFELRMIFLLLLAHLLLNVRLVEILATKRFRKARFVTLLYIVTSLILQQRSRVFEVGAVMAFAHLMWDGDKIRLKYFVVLGVALLVPNIIVLGRLGWPEDIHTLINGIFSFEYTVLFNNLLSAAINSGPDWGSQFTFTPSLGLLLPSPLRTLLSLEIMKSDYYEDLAEAANISNGGFALLAELYTNFGWYAPLILAAVGALIGYFSARAMRVGRVSVLTSASTLLYTAFILAFRNDLGVFVKYVIQLLVIASTMHLLLKPSRHYRAERQAT